MTERFRQIPASIHQHGLAKTVAFVSVDIEEMARRFSLELESHIDDMGPLRTGLLEIVANGKQFALQRHMHGAPGTEILIQERSENPAQDLEEILSLLNLTHKELEWITPEAKL